MIWVWHPLMRYLGMAPTRAPFGHGACSYSIEAWRPFLLHFGTAPTHASCGGGAHSCSSRLGTAPTCALPRLVVQSMVPRQNWSPGMSAAAVIDPPPAVDGPPPQIIGKMNPVSFG